MHLGFKSNAPLSPGTTKTIIHSLSEPTFVRSKGELVATSFGLHQRSMELKGVTYSAINITWGDVVTAWYSTGINNIEVYLPLSPKKIKRLKHLQPLLTLLKLPGLPSLIGTLVDYVVKGPSQYSLEHDRCTLWGEVQNAHGDRREATFETPNGYQLTISIATIYIDWLLRQSNIKSGYLTPTQCFPAELFFSMPGVSPLQWKDQQPSTCPDESTTTAAIE